MKMQTYATAAEHAALMAETKATMDRAISAQLARTLDKVRRPRRDGLTEAQRDALRDRINADAEVAMHEAYRQYGEGTTRYREMVRYVKDRRAALLRYHADRQRLTEACTEARQAIYEAMKQGDTAAAERIAHEFFERPAIAP